MPLINPGPLDPQPRPKKSASWLWVGGLAIVLAGAALASVLLSPVGERLFQRPPRVVRVAQAPLVTAPEPAAVEPKPAEPKPAKPEPSDVTLDGEVEIKLAPSEERAPAEPEPELEPVVPAKQEARREAMPDPTAPLVRQPPPPKQRGPTTKAGEALRLFNEGEVEAAIDAAKDSGSSSLATRLVSFRKEAALGESARAKGDTKSAMRHLATAAALDDKLSRGWSKPGAEVRAELTRVLVELGEQELTAGDATQASVLLQKALVYGPGDEKALQLLRKVKTSQALQADVAKEPTPEPAAEPAPPDPRSEADKAFGE